MPWDTISPLLYYIMYPPENIHTPPSPPPLQQKALEIPGGGGGVLCKAQKLKEMCEALLEFPEGCPGGS